MSVDEGNTPALNYLWLPFLGTEETDVCPGSLRAIIGNPEARPSNAMLTPHPTPIMAHLRVTLPWVVFPSALQAYVTVLEKAQLRQHYVKAAHLDSNNAVLLEILVSM